MNAIQRNTDQDRIRLIKEDLMKRLEPYYKRLSEIQLNKPTTRMIVTDSKVMYDHGEDSLEEIEIKRIISIETKAAHEAVERGF